MVGITVFQEISHTCLGIEREIEWTLMKISPSTSCMLRLFDKLVFCCPPFPQQPTEYFDMGIFLAFFVVVSLVCLILLIKIKLKQRRSQVNLENTLSSPLEQKCSRLTV